MVKCKGCDKDFNPKFLKSTKRGPILFCSNKCANKRGFKNLGSSIIMGEKDSAFLVLNGIICE